MKYFIILLLAGISCLWFFGKTQPIVVIDHTTVGNRQVSCSKCGGSGSVETLATCPKCNGTGKGEDHFKSRATRKPLTGLESGLICIPCRGTGKILRREKCSQCGGTGREASAESQKRKIVRADLSLCEKIFAYCLIKPNANCKPQRKLDGSYPLITKYIETKANPAYNARVVKWEPARLEGAEWIIQTVIEFKDKNGQWVQEGREFIVVNREVKESRKTE